MARSPGFSGAVSVRLGPAGRGVQHAVAQLILSDRIDHGCDLRRCDVDSVVDGAADMIVQLGLLGCGKFLFGVSRFAWPTTAATRRSPSARARASRSRWLSASRWRMRVVAASRRRSSDGSEARCRGGGGAGEVAGCRWRADRSRRADPAGCRAMSGQRWLLGRRC